MSTPAAPASIMCDGTEFWKGVEPFGRLAESFFSQRVSRIAVRELVSCSEKTSIREAADRMSRRRCSSIFVKNAAGDATGVVTDTDLRRRVIAAGLDFSHPVSEIMSSPLQTISEDALVFEALIEMMQARIKHLAVTDRSAKVIGVLTNNDLLTVQGQSPLFLAREIEAAAGVEELIQVHQRLPRVIASLINSGARAQNVTRMVATVADAVWQIVEPAIRSAKQQNKAPPAI